MLLHPVHRTAMKKSCTRYSATTAALSALRDRVGPGDNFGTITFEFSGNIRRAKRSAMSQRVQFRLSSLLLLVGICAGYFGLVEWIGFWFSVPVAVFLVCFVPEWLLRPLVAQAASEPTRFTAVRIVTVIVCALSAGLAAMLSTSDGVPTLAAPIPLLVVIPAVIADSYEMPAVSFMAIPVVSFVIFNLSAAGSRRASIPLRFPILLGLATVLSVVYLMHGWRYGLRYQSRDYTVGVTVINAAFVLGLWSLWWWLRRDASFASRILFGTLLHYWLFWFAFPWLGELP